MAYHHVISIEQRTSDSSGKKGPSCPNCGKQRLDPESCPFCGIVFSRFDPQRTSPKVQTLAAGGKRSLGTLGPVGLGRYSRLFRQLAKMLGAGIPLTSSLEKLKTSHSSLTQPLQATINGLDNGLNFTRSLEEANFTFPHFVWAHIEAGEYSGNLETLLLSLADELETRRRWIMEQIFNFRTLWLIALFVFAALSLSVTESVRNLNPEIVDHGQIAILAGIGKGALGRFTLYFIGIAIVVLTFAFYQIWWKRQLIGRFAFMEKLQLTTPLFGQIAQMEAWRRYISLLAKLLESGLSIQKALQFSQQDVEFPSWRHEFGKIQETLDRGGTLGEGFHSLSFIPKNLAVEIEVGAQTGTLTESLFKDASHLEERIKQLRNLVQVVFLVASLLIGALVTILIFARGLGAWIPLYEKVLYD